MNGDRSSVVPVAIVMISLNEAHNMEAVLQSLAGWAQEVFLVDSYSADNTVDIALRYGVHVVQRRFRGFGDQWNFALAELPITAPWTMKLDPDERITEELKAGISQAIARGDSDGLVIERRLWFMGSRLPVTQTLLRVWRTGRCRFSDVLVNEHPLVEGRITTVAGALEHHDSPDLHHWFEKQNRYSSAEALSSYRGAALSAQPRLFGSALERRMWVKRLQTRLPVGSVAVFLYSYGLQGAWRAGRVGFVWASLRVTVHRMRALKLYEMRLTGKELRLTAATLGEPHPMADQAAEANDFTSDPANLKCRSSGN